MSIQYIIKVNTVTPDNQPVFFDIPKYGEPPEVGEEVFLDYEARNRNFVCEGGVLIESSINSPTPVFLTEVIDLNWVT